jgi:enediyne biosynthesis protein E4
MPPRANPALPEVAISRCAGIAALSHNNHDGTFTEVAERASVTNNRWGLGIAVGDYNNDGWPEIYVTKLG